MCTDICLVISQQTGALFKLDIHTGLKFYDVFFFFVNKLILYVLLPQAEFNQTRRREEAPKKANIELSNT